MRELAIHLCGRKVLQEEEQRQRSKVGACLAHCRNIKEAAWLNWREWAWRLVGDGIGKVKEEVSLCGASSDMVRTSAFTLPEDFQQSCEMTDPTYIWIGSLCQYRGARAEAGSPFGRLFQFALELLEPWTKTVEVKVARRN